MEAKIGRVRLDPRRLEVNCNNNELKIQQIAGKKTGFPPIIVLPDNDATLWVADGNNRAKAALRAGKPIDALLVDDDYRVGTQSALDRVLGIFFRKNESESNPDEV